MTTTDNQPKSTITRKLDDHEQVSSLNDISYRFDLDKSKYQVRIPQAEETEERVVVYVEPVDEP